jgi:phage baseplate assembly protein V
MAETFRQDSVAGARSVLEDFDPFLVRLRQHVTRALIAATHSGGDVIRHDLAKLRDEPGVQAEHFESFGLTSVPPPDLEAAVVCPQGIRSHALVVGVADRLHRPRDLKVGEVALYSAEGDRLVFRQGHLVELTCSRLTVEAPGGVRLNTPLLEVTGTVRAAKLEETPPSLDAARDTEAE